MSSVFDFRASWAGRGRIDLSEREEREGESGYFSKTLVDDQSAEFSITVRVSNDEDEYGDDLSDAISIELNAYHVENPETARTFHAHMRRDLTLKEARELRDWLSFVIEHRQ